MKQKNCCKFRRKGQFKNSQSLRKRVNYKNLLTICDFTLKIVQIPLGIQKSTIRVVCEGSPSMNAEMSKFMNYVSVTPNQVSPIQQYFRSQIFRH